MKKPERARHITKTATGLLLLSITTSIGCGLAQAMADDERFPRPPQIKKAVDFWTRVYSEVDSNSGLIHDSRALDVVYEVYSLPTNAGRKGQNRLIRKRIQHYKQLLETIAETPEAKLDREGHRIKRLWGSEASASQLRQAGNRIRFQRGQSDRMNRGLKRAARYENRIRQILRDTGLPEQLAALPHVESSYNPKVRSKAGAAGSS